MHIELSVFVYQSKLISFRNDGDDGPKSRGLEKKIEKRAYSKGDGGVYQRSRAR